MNTYIATFYSHFGAVRFTKELGALGIKGRTMPVPRNLSSSCGTCVRYEADSDLSSLASDEVEKIVEITSEGYATRYQAENS